MNKSTQGKTKMLRYIEDLVRNKHFKRLLKRLRKQQRDHTFPEGMYVNWSLEERQKADLFDKEIGSIIAGYEVLRKRCNKLLRDDEFIIREKIAQRYRLDNDLIHLAVAMSEKNDDSIEFCKDGGIMDEPDMCKLMDMGDDELNPENPSEEIIHLNHIRQLFLTAYSVAIFVHPRASKRDVLDYVEKKWKWIDNMIRTSSDEKALKFGKRKYDQKIIDFIWEIQSLSTNQIKKKLNEKFPENDIVYFEISKIIQLEKERRSRN